MGSELTGRNDFPSFYRNGLVSSATARKRAIVTSPRSSSSRGFPLACFRSCPWLERNQVHRRDRTRLSSNFSLSRAREHQMQRIFYEDSKTIERTPTMLIAIFLSRLEVPTSDISVDETVVSIYGVFLISMQMSSDAFVVVTTTNTIADGRRRDVERTRKLRQEVERWNDFNGKLARVLKYRVNKFQRARRRTYYAGWDTDSSHDRVPFFFQW